jgi:hypothetical protein
MKKIVINDVAFGLVWPGLQARFRYAAFPGLKARPHKNKIAPQYIEHRSSNDMRDAINYFAFLFKPEEIKP